MKSDRGEGHHKGYGIYVAVWLSLLILTSLTVGVAGTNLRTLAVVTALAIALVKSALVVSVFMHLKDEDRAFKWMLLLVVMIMAVVLLLTFSDTLFR